MSNFRKDLDEFVNRIRSIKEHLHSEEATKTSLILPFIQLLGYDIFNPTELLPEYVADVGIKKGEKVDYAIMKDGSPQILIEAKCLGDDLTKHYSQLYRYFTTTPSKFAVLTDGVIYRFYTDIEEVNIMDSEPFIEIDLLNLKEDDVILLNHFRKNNFNTDIVSNYILDLKFSKDIRVRVSELLSNPSDDLVSLIVGSKNRDKFRGIVEKVLTEYVHKDVVDCNYIKDREVSVVPLCEFNYKNLSYKYGKLIPISLCVDGIELELNSWKDASRVAISYLYKKYKDTLRNYIDVPYKNTKVLFYSSMELLLQNYTIGTKIGRVYKVDDGVYLYINYGPIDTIKFILSVVDTLGLDKDYFSIKYSISE